MYPIPPICMRKAITILPNSVKSFAVSLIMSPVTHVAEVEVYRASMKEILLPEKGRRRSMVPILIIIKYTTSMLREMVETGRNSLIGI